MDNTEVASTTLAATTASDLWDSGSDALRAQLAEKTWNTWFREVRPVRFDGDRGSYRMPPRLHEHTDELISGPD